MEHHKTRKLYDRAYAMWKAGVPVPDISDAIGKKPQTIYQAFKRYGYTTDGRNRTRGLNKSNAYHEIEWLLDFADVGEPVELHGVDTYTGNYRRVHQMIQYIQRRRGWIVSTRMKGEFKHKQPVMIVTKEAIGL